VGKSAFVLVAATACVTACTLVTGVGDLDPSLAPGVLLGGDGGPGGPRDAIPAADAPPPFDAGEPFDVVDIADVGGADRSTGLSNQQHLVWAPKAARWILFYVTTAAPGALRTKISADFVTWQDGAELVLPHPHGGEGRNFAVARATIADRDVFHLAMSFRVANDDHREYGARAVLTGDALAFETPAEVTRSAASTSSIDVDGPSVAVAGDGFVGHFTGYRTNNADGTGGTGNAYALRSSVADTGGAWSATYANTTIEVVATICNARATVPVGASGLLHFYEKGDLDPNPRNVRWSRTTGSGWSAELDVFDGAAAMAPGDWALLRTGDADVHVVRYALAGTFDHRRYDGAAMQGGAPIAGEALESGAGLALAPLDGSRMVLVGVSPSEALRAATWDGTAWSPWATLVGPAATARRWLTTGGIAGGPSAVAWTENRGSAHVIAGIRIR
jgi:hypothetical protein